MTGVVAARFSGVPRTGFSYLNGRARMPIQNITIPEVFVGRRRELKWLESHYFDEKLWFTPLSIVGESGIGKTALVGHFLDKHKIPNICWRFRSSAEVPLALVSLQQKIRVADVDRVAVVLDEVDSLDNSSIRSLISGLQVFKAVRRIFITALAQPNLDLAPAIALGPLNSRDIAAFFRTYDRHHILEWPDWAEVKTAIGGNPAMLQLLAIVARDFGVREMLRVAQGQVYDLSPQLSQQKILTIAKPKIITVNEFLIESLKKEPKGVFNLTPRKFEELVFELLRGMGHEAQLTQETRDGGRDILAYIDTGMGHKLLCLIEAKRWKQEHTVGIDVVKKLYATFCDEQANSAMVVTTSTFSPDAHAFQKRHHWQLQLREYDHLVKWIERYKTGSKLIFPI